MLGASLLVCGYGMYKVGQGNLEKRYVSSLHFRQTLPSLLGACMPTCMIYADVSLACRELKREKVWSRIHLVPLLLAEGDRDAFRREQAALAREKEIMKDVPGWEVSTESYYCECSQA